MMVIIKTQDIVFQDSEVGEKKSSHSIILAVASITYNYYTYIVVIIISLLYSISFINEKFSNTNTIPKHITLILLIVIVIVIVILLTNNANSNSTTIYYDVLTIIYQNNIQINLYINSN